MEQELEYQKYLDFTVKVHSWAGIKPDHRLLRGRFLLNSTEGEATFVQAAQPAARSQEVGRTNHSRFIRRPDGTYTVTFRLRGDEKYLKSDMQAEIREVVDTILEDKAQQDREKKINYLKPKES